MRDHQKSCPNKVNPNNLIDRLKFEDGYSNEIRKCNIIRAIRHAKKLEGLLSPEEVAEAIHGENKEIMDKKLTIVCSLQQPAVMGRKRDATIPIELERWFGDFPITHDKTVKDLADWDCMGEIEDWYNLRPNDLPTSAPLQEWFHCLPLGRGRRVEDFETWRNMDVERCLWFDSRPSAARGIPNRISTFLNIILCISNLNLRISFVSGQVSSVDIKQAFTKQQETGAEEQAAPGNPCEQKKDISQSYTDNAKIAKKRIPPLPKTINRNLRDQDAHRTDGEHYKSSLPILGLTSFVSCA